MKRVCNCHFRMLQTTISLASSDTPYVSGRSVGCLYKRRQQLLFGSASHQRKTTSGVYGVEDAFRAGHGQSGLFCLLSLGSPCADPWAMMWLHDILDFNHTFEGPSRPTGRALRFLSSVTIGGTSRIFLVSVVVFICLSASNVR